MSALPLLLGIHNETLVSVTRQEKEKAVRMENKNFLDGKCLKKESQKNL